MESTGVCWIPVWNILERKKWKLELMLVNPATVRALRGQTPDRIAEYLQYGLLRASFVPAKPVPELRDLTRMRSHIQRDRNRVINRIGGLLETANIKVESVASHIVGKSGRAILERLAEGSTKRRTAGRTGAVAFEEKDPRSDSGSGPKAGRALPLDTEETAEETSVTGRGVDGNRCQGFARSTKSTKMR